MIDNDGTAIIAAAAARFHENKVAVQIEFGQGNIAFAIGGMDIDTIAGVKVDIGSEERSCHIEII